MKIYDIEMKKYVGNFPVYPEIKRMQILSKMVRKCWKEVSVQTDAKQISHFNLKLDLILKFDYSGSAKANSMNFEFLQMDQNI